MKMSEEAISPPAGEAEASGVTPEMLKWLQEPEDMDALDEALAYLNLSDQSTFYVPKLSPEEIVKEQTAAKAAGLSPAALQQLRELRTNGQLGTFLDVALPQTYALYRETRDDGKTKLYLECGCQTDVLKTTKAVKIAGREIEAVYAEAAPGFNPHAYSQLAANRLRVHFPEVNEIRELYHRHKSGEQPYVFISGWGVPEEPGPLVGLYSIEFGYGAEGNKRFREDSLPSFGIDEEEWDAHFKSVTSPPKDDPEGKPEVQAPYHFIISSVSHGGDPQEGSKTCVCTAGFRWEEIPEPP